MRVEYATAVYGEDEIQAVVDVLRTRWLAPASQANEFESQMAVLSDKKHGLFVNSGSSANLLAVNSLGLPLHKDGLPAEIITPACTFPLTVAPIIQSGFISVLVEVELGTYNANVQQVEDAVSPQTVAIMVPHAVGNLNDMPKLREIADKYDLKLIEDSCDIIGGSINGLSSGHWSDVTTYSFYFVHHITAMGGGGMVLVNDAKTHDRMWSMRDWGRAGVGYDENVDERYRNTLAGVPYDAKFTFTQIGFNLKPVEAQAAFALVQLDKLDQFNQRRRDNIVKLTDFFESYEEHFFLPKVVAGADSPFLYFPLTIRDESPIKRHELVRFMESNSIQTRPLLAGNILQQPGYKDMPHRKVSNLSVSNKILRDGFVIPCHHGLTSEMLAHVMDMYDRYLNAEI